jgi:ferredoxin
MTTTSRSGTRTVSLRLHIDWVACDGRGLCTELLPELLTEDPWGFPAPVAVSGREPLPPNGIPVPAELGPDARAAVAACPLLALRLESGR